MSSVQFNNEKNLLVMMGFVKKPEIIAASFKATLIKTKKEFLCRIPKMIGGEQDILIVRNGNKELFLVTIMDAIIGNITCVTTKPNHGNNAWRYPDNPYEIAIDGNDCVNVFNRKRGILVTGNKNAVAKRDYVTFVTTNLIACKLLAKKKNLGEIASGKVIMMV